MQRSRSRESDQFVEVNDTRKGFKYKKKTLNAPTSETVAFDDLSEEISSPVGKRKRETTSNQSSNVRPKSNASIERVSDGKAEKSRKSVENSGSIDYDKVITSPLPLAKHTRVIGKSSPEKCSTEAETKSVMNLAPNSMKIVKSYYPSIQHDFAQLRTTDQHPLATSHKDTLVKLVTDVCQTEIAGLQHYSDQNKGREAVISFLCEILSKLPVEVAASVDDSTIFSPELTAEEERERESLEEQLKELKMQSSELLKFENDIAEFGTRYNSWIHGASEHGETDSTDVSHKVLDISELSRQYEDRLLRLNTNCQSLINLGQQLEAAKTDARLAQSALYDTAQTVREKSSSSKAASNNPKELIRNYISL